LGEAATGLGRPAGPVALVAVLVAGSVVMVRHRLRRRAAVDPDGA